MSMTSAISSIGSMSRPSFSSGKNATTATSGNQTPRATPNEKELEVKEKFQDFVAGTFYGTMMKSLRTSLKKTPYMHGGQAEDIFQSQLDNHFSDALAKSHGGRFADGLYQSYAREHGIEFDQQA